MTNPRVSQHSAAALVVDGEIVAAAQEERFTRKKQMHDLRRTFENEVDTAVAHHAFDRIGLLAARLERLHVLVDLEALILESLP